MEFFTDDIRRDPFPIYAQLRKASPLLYVPPPFNSWLIFDYETVKRVLTEHELFSSAVPAPKNWFLFSDPPAHSKLRALISKAFTPRMIAGLQTRICEISRGLLDHVLARGEMDLVSDYAAPLPMKIISEMIGIPSENWAQFKRWSDGIMKLSYARSSPEERAMASREFAHATTEMSPYLAALIEERRKSPRDDLLTRLIEAEVEGQRLNHDEILGFFQLLIVGGQETTTNLITNAILCLLDNPEQLAQLRATPELLPSAIEEVLRYRSPVQWMMRTPRRDVLIHGQTIPAGALMMPVIGSANRDEKIFTFAARFDILRDPNPHIAFGHGIHSCLGAALARMEGRIALRDLLERLPGLKQKNQGPWPPRKALQVHGPECFPMEF